MEPELKMIPERLLVGQKMIFSFADNRTTELWRRFMPLRQSIVASNGNLYSAAIFSEGFFNAFDPTKPFEKWAAVQVDSFHFVPSNMQKLIVPAGLYAVFHYKGSSADSPAFYRQIFSEWLPASGYRIDNRPHFEIMGDKYRNADPNSEEDIYIPVRVSEI